MAAPQRWSVPSAVTTCLGLGTVSLVARLHPMSLTCRLAIAIPLMALVPVFLFHGREP
jgi:hypothetical protein